MKKAIKRTILILSVVIVLILLLSGVLFAVGAFRYDKPIVSVKKLRYTSFDTDRKGFDVEIVLEIDNPNLFKLSIIQVNGDVYIDENLVGHLHNDSGLNIGGHSSSDLVISVHIDDQEMRLYNGKELIVEGKTLGKYLFYRRDSPFDEKISLSPYNGDLENIPPISIIEGPHAALILEEVQFIGSHSYDTDGQITSFSWDFGDGSTENGQDVMHKYIRKGVYRVDLNIVDDKGASTSAIHQIVITLVPGLEPHIYIEMDL